MTPTGDDFTEGVLAIVAAIPAGKVMTYGDIAAVLGSRAARMVGRVMAYHGSEVPWWRVVRAGGWLPPGKEQRAIDRLSDEGAPLIAGDPFPRVDLRQARHRP